MGKKFRYSHGRRCTGRLENYAVERQWDASGHQLIMVLCKRDRTEKIRATFDQVKWKVLKLESSNDEGRMEVQE